MDGQAVELERKEEPATHGTARIDGVVVGMLMGFAEDGHPLVLFPGNPATRPAPARSTVALAGTDIGTEVALMFEAGDARAPIVMGRMHKPQTAPVEVEADKDRLEFKAEKEVVIRCGKASITLTRAGKVLIRGSYVFSRSTGVNKIKGGSVQLN